MFLSLYGQNPDNHTNTFEIGLKIYSLRQNPIGINATNEYVDEFVSKYINGLYITFLKREDIVFFNEHEARINPINLVGISYKIK